MRNFSGYKWLKIQFYLILLFFMPLTVFAAEASKLDWIDKLSKMIPSEAGAVAAMAVGLELILRLFKTKKPRSILYLIGDGARALGDLLSNIGTFLDKLLPQRTK